MVLVEDGITEFQRAWIRFRLSSSGIVKILHGEPTDDIMHEASMDIIRQELNKHSSLLERLFGDLSEYYVSTDGRLVI